MIFSELSDQDTSAVAKVFPITNEIPHSYDSIRVRELQYFCLKESITKVNLGVGVHVHSRGREGTFESEFDLLSHQAFRDHGIRTSVQGLSFEHWLPLPISRSHWRSVRAEDVSDSHRELAHAAKLKHGSDVGVVEHFMNDIVVKFSQGGRVVLRPRRPELPDPRVGKGRSNPTSPSSTSCSASPRTRRTQESSTRRTRRSAASPRAGPPKPTAPATTPSSSPPSSATTASRTSTSDSPLSRKPSSATLSGCSTPRAPVCRNWPIWNRAPVSESPPQTHVPGVQGPPTASPCSGTSSVRPPAPVTKLLSSSLSDIRDGTVRRPMAHRPRGMAECNGCGDQEDLKT